MNKLERTEVAIGWSLVSRTGYATCSAKDVRPATHQARPSHDEVRLHGLDGSFTARVA